MTPAGGPKTKDLDLPDSRCWTSPAREVRVGDACRSALLPDIEAGEAQRDPGPPPIYFVKAQPSYAVVMRLYRDYAIVAPVAVAEAQSNADAFREVVESGPYEKLWVRLPTLGGAWDDPAVALLFKPHTQLASRLTYNRVALTGPRLSVHHE